MISTFQKLKTFSMCILIHIIIAIILTMEIGLINGAPNGVMYLPHLPPPEPEGQESFPQDLTLEFIKWINSPEGRNRKLLTPKRRNDYQHYLKNPYSKSEHYNPKERRRQASEKFHCLRNFDIQDNQIYHQPEYSEGKQWPARYCACDYDAVEIIQCIHHILHHASKWDSMRFSLLLTMLIRGGQSIPVLCSELLWYHLEGRQLGSKQMCTM